MKPATIGLSAALLASALPACDGDGSSARPSSTASGTSSGGASAGGGGATGSGGAGTGGSIGSGGYGGAPACDETLALVQAYAAAHPGSDADINAKTPAEIAADPDAQKLMALCGADQRPVIPHLAWEYGGSDHAWIDPTASALFYCVYTPVDPSTDNWQYDAAADHVTADVYVGCPDLNPCHAQTGADQVLACLGDPTNIEILVDIASYNDGMDAGLSLSEATTDLYLILSGGTKVHLYTGL